MENEMKNLEYFDEEFQYEAVKALLEQPGLMGKMNKVLDQNAFNDKSLRQIVCIIKDYYKKCGMVPDYVALKVKVKEKITTAGDLGDALTAIAKLKSASSQGQDTIVESFTTFFKLKYLVKTANYIISSVNENEEAEKINKKSLKMFEDLNKMGDVGAECVMFDEETIRRACMTGDNESIPTGIKELDYRLYGGLGRGEIGLFSAPTGYGKTTAGTIFAHNAALQGYNALQIFFEDKPDDIVRKHVAMETETNSNRFRRMSEQDADTVIDSLQELGTMPQLQNNLRLCRMADGSTTVEDIEFRIREYINTEGFRPDVVVIDYFSSLKHTTDPRKDKLTAQASCMRKIVERIAHQFNCAVWVMQQTNRQAVSKDEDSGMSSWQGSFEATQPASVWLQLRRSKEQKENFRADIIFQKTRHSQPKEDLLNIVFDNSKLQIDCTDSGDSFANSLELTDEDIYESRYYPEGYLGEGEC